MKLIKKTDLMAFVPVKKRDGKKKVILLPKPVVKEKPAHRKKDTLFPAKSPDSDDSGSDANEQHAEHFTGYYTVR